MAGVLKIVHLDYAIGIIAESLEQALEAKKQLKIKVLNKFQLVFFGQIACLA